MRRLTKAEREHARRVGVSELVYVVELAAASTSPAIHAFAAVILLRAVSIATRKGRAKAFTERDIQKFLAWWKGVALA